MGRSTLAIRSKWKVLSMQMDPSLYHVWRSPPRKMFLGCSNWGMTNLPLWIPMMTMPMSIMTSMMTTAMMRISTTIMAMMRISMMTRVTMPASIMPMSMTTMAALSAQAMTTPRMIIPPVAAIVARTAEERIAAAEEREAEAEAVAMIVAGRAVAARPAGCLPVVNKIV